MWFSPKSSAELAWMASSVAVISSWVSGTSTPLSAARLNCVGNRQFPSAQASYSSTLNKSAAITKSPDGPTTPATSEDTTTRTSPIRSAKAIESSKANNTTATSTTASNRPPCIQDLGPSTNFRCHNQLKRGMFSLQIPSNTSQDRPGPISKNKTLR
jgi:hypothetical protein